MSVISEDVFEVDHIHRVNSESNLKWKYPSQPDISKVEKEQLLKCPIDGDWDILSNRNSVYTLRNHESINKMFLDL